MKMKILPIISIIVITVMSIIGFSLLYYFEHYSKQPSYGFYKSLANDVGFSKEHLWQIHDVIVDGQIMVVTADAKPYVILQVNKYLKNPQNATYLTVWGDFGFNDDCADYRDECYHIVAYLYKNKNGIYHKGETFGRVTDSCNVQCIIGMR